MILLTVVTAALVGVFTYHNLESKILPLELGRLESGARLMADRLDSYVRDARADVKAMRGAPAIDAFVRAREAGGRDGETGRTTAALRDDIARLFSALLEAKPSYVQLRLIGVADGGREIVRIDRMGPDDKVRQVPEADLQQKAHRGFVVDTLGLPAGKVYVSELDLNQEHGRIEVPHMPTLRTATPVYDADGKVFGIIVLNIDMRPAFAALNARVAEGGSLYVVNGEGDFLVHPDPARTFGFELGERHTLKQQFPDLPLPAVDHSLSGTFVSDDRYFGAAAASVRLAGGPRVTVLQTLPYSVIVAPMESIRDSSLMAALAAMLLAVLLAVALARSLGRPIRRMTAAVQDANAGRPLSLPTDAEGEIGVLARAFGHYVQRERTFSAALQSSDDAVVATDLNGTITGWNPAAEALYGYSTEEVLGASAAMLLPEDALPALSETLRQVEKGHGFQDVEVVHVAKDGTRLMLEARVSSVRGATGEAVGALAILSDLSEKRDLEAKFRLAFEASPSGMIILDASGRITLANAEMEHMFGYPAGELIGSPISRLVPEEIREQQEALLTAYVADPAPRHIGLANALTGLRRDGRRFPIEVGLQPIRTYRELLILMVVVDVSERREAEALIASKTAELERSNAELEQFAYVASHDLREPLRMVASYTELLSERYRGRLDDRADKYIGYVVDGARRMQQLVADLLALSRVGTQGKPLVPVDAGAVVANVLRAMSRAIADAGASISVAPLPVVAADETQLGQLFQNLISNALKFRAPDRVPAIAIDAVPAGVLWEFTVSDNGIGIDRQYSDRIFQMFQRLHGRGQYEGNGIGLAIAKKIVERHGGRIWFESAPGEGTTFHVVLPAAARTGQREQELTDGDIA